MSEHPSLEPSSKPEETIIEKLEREISELKEQNMNHVERMTKLQELKQTLQLLQQEQDSLANKEQRYIDMLEKEALKLLIKKYGGTVPPE